MSKWSWKEGEFEVFRSNCGGGGVGCDHSCGVLIYVKDGRLVKVEGDPNYPYNQGRLCSKALAITQIVYHPDRILHPMKRVGERGEGKWQKITWEEAFDIITTKLKEIKEKYGPEAVAFHSGTGRGYSPWISKLCFSFGSPNWVTPGHYCYFPRILGNALTFGVRLDSWVDCAHQFPDRYKNPAWRKPECLIIWGANTPETATLLTFNGWIVDLMRMGTQLVVVDPRLTFAASKAKLWLQIRPGADAALALGMLHVIVEEGLYDREFVEKWTNAPFLVRCDTNRLLREREVTGKESANFVVWDSKTNQPAIWDIKELKYVPPEIEPTLDVEVDVKLADGRVVRCKTVWRMFRERLKEYSPERVSEITWVPSNKIVEAARFFATTKPAAIQQGLSLDQSHQSFQNQRLISLLMALTGNFDIPGGWTSERKPWNIISHDMAWGWEKLPLEVAKKCLDISKHPLLNEAGVFSPANPNDFIETMITGKPYKVRALVSIGGGCLLTSGEGTKRIIEGLMKLDFIVQADLLPSPMTEIADVVLPVATWVERFNLKAWWTPLTAQCKALRVGDVKCDLEIICELGRRLCPDKWLWKTPEELFDWCLKPLNITFKEFRERMPMYPPYLYKKYEKGLERRDGKPGFNTPSGKVEIWCSYVEGLGIDPLPHHTEPYESPYSTPWLTKEYPFILTTGGRKPAFFHSEGRQIPWLRELHSDPLVEINTKTAEQLGIKDGDWVYIETRRGRCKMKAKLSIGIHPKVIRAEHNWWYPEKLGKAPLHQVLEPNCNQVVSYEIPDPAIGSTPVRTCLCKVYKA